MCRSTAGRRPPSTARIEDTGADRALALNAFPRGIGEMIEYFHRLTDRRDGGGAGEARSRRPEDCGRRWRWRCACASRSTPAIARRSARASPSWRCRPTRPSAWSASTAPSTPSGTRSATAPPISAIYSKRALLGRRLHRQRALLAERQVGRHRARPGPSSTAASTTSCASRSCAASSTSCVGQLPDPFRLFRAGGPLAALQRLQLFTCPILRPGRASALP